LPENFAHLKFDPPEGLQSILTLFNLIPDPAIIYQQNDDAILAANNALFLLTNLGESDFINQSIQSLLPSITDTDPISGHDKKAYLRHKKQSLIPVTVRIFPFSHADKNLIIVLKPEESLLINKPLASEQLTIIEKLTIYNQIRRDDHAT